MVRTLEPVKASGAWLGPFSGFGTLLIPDNAGISSPVQLGNLSAWYSATPNSLIVDSANRVALWADQSGNSGVGRATSSGLYLTGASGGYAYSTDSAALRPTTQLEIVQRVALRDWNSAATQCLVAKYTGSDTNITYIFRNSAAKPYLTISLDGITANVITIAPSGTMVVSDGATIWVKCTWRSSDGLMTVYYAPDQSAEPTVWTSIGTGTGGAGGSLYQTTATFLETGSRNGGSSQLAKGVFYQTIVRNTIGGVDAYNANFTGQSCNATTFTESSSNAATVYINGTAVLGWVDPITSDGLYLNGASGSYASVPDSAALSITGDIDLRGYVALDNWTPALSNNIIAKRTTNFAYRLQVNNGGGLAFVWSVDGSAAIVRNSTANPVVSNFAPLWVRATLDVDNGAGGHTVVFYTSTDGVAWTQLGDAVTTGGATSIADTTNPVEFGAQANGTAQWLVGRIFRAQILNGINGTLALDANFTGQPLKAGSFVESSANAAVVTMNGGAVLNNYSSTGSALVCPALGGNYASSPDSTAISVTGDIDVRVLASATDWTPSSSRDFMGKRSGAGQFSWQFQLETAGTITFYFTLDGTTQQNATSNAAPAVSDYGTIWLRATRASATGTVTFYTSSDGVAWTQLGTTVASPAGAIFDSTAALEIGSVLGGTAALWSGNIYRAIVLNGINGTVVFDADFRRVPKLATSFTESSTNSALVTINATGSLGIRVQGARDLYQNTVASQPVYLPWAGTNYGYLNGVVGNVYTVPDSASLDVTGNIDFRIQLSLGSWNPATSIHLVSKFSVQFSYYLAIINGTGVLRMGTSVDGTTQRTANSTVGLSGLLTNYSTYWLRATRASASGNTNFYYGTDGVNWTQLGAADVATTAGAIFAGTDSLSIGAQNNGATPIDGKIYRAQIYASVTGTNLRFDFDPSVYLSGSTFVEQSGNNGIVTLAGGATVVTRSCVYADGVDDWIQAPAFALSQPQTNYWTGQQTTWANARRIFSSPNGFAINYQSGVSPAINAYAGANLVLSPVLPMQTGGILTTNFNGANGTFRLNKNTVITGNIGGSASSGYCVGADGGGGNPSNTSHSEAILFSAAHNTPTQDRVIQYLGRRWRIPV